MRFSRSITLATVCISGASAFLAPGASSSSRVVGISPQSRTTAAATTTSSTLRPSTMPTITSTSLSAMGMENIGSSSLELASSAMSSVSSTVNSITSSSLFTYFVERVIEAAVPATFSIIVIFFFFAQFKGMRGDAERDDEEAESVNAVADLYNDLYGSTRGNGILPRRAGGGGGFGRGGVFQAPQLPKNLGLPKKEYIRMTNLNEMYSSYDFSVRKATASKAQASSIFRRQSFDRALKLALNADPGDGTATGTSTLSGSTKAKLLQVERDFLKEGKKLVQELQAAESALAQMTMDAALSKLGVAEDKAEAASNTTGVVDAEIVPDAELSAVDNVTSLLATTTTPAGESKGLSFLPNMGTASLRKKQDELLRRIANTQKKLKQLELTFIEQAMAAVGTKRAFGLRNALLGDIAVRGTGSLLLQLQERPLSTLLKAGGSGEAGGSAGGSSIGKSLYVMRFPGDVQASQLNELREEVTAIVRNAQPGDEALVVLQSGGGTVTGYGLAAGQLVRLKEKGMYLTIAVEQVAASGGYMMSCVADKIVASPFAVLGSIGVISEIPNVYERLKEEGIEFQTVTAGKFKRTLTPTKKVTREDMAKSKEDIENIFNLFKGWVEQNRPQLDIDKVATGETWFGPDALERGLCDEIKTVDDILLEYVDSGFSVYDVKYDPPPDVPSSLSFLFANEGDVPQLEKGGRGSGNSLGRRAIRWVVQSFAEEVQDALSDPNSSTSSPERRYMAQDSSSDRVRVSDENIW